MTRPLKPRLTDITRELSRNSSWAKTPTYKTRFASTAMPWLDKKHCPTRKAQAKVNAKLALPKLGPIDE